VPPRAPAAAPVHLNAAAESSWPALPRSIAGLGAAATKSRHRRMVVYGRRMVDRTRRQPIRVLLRPRPSASLSHSCGRAPQAAHQSNQLLASLCGVNRARGRRAKLHILSLIPWHRREKEESVNWACSPMARRSDETLPIRIQILVLVPFPGFFRIYRRYGPVWHSSASPVELFFKNNSMSNFMSGGESHIFAASPCA
jgi:hypothetical protein